MASSGSDPEFEMDEGTSASDSDHGGEELATDSDGGDGVQPAKRRKVVGKPPHEALHGATNGIDHAEDAEASLLQLELQELLAEAAVSDRDAAALQTLASNIEDVLQALPEANVDPSPLRGFLADFQFPPARSFLFRPPQSIEIVGSFALDAATLPSVVLDLALVMPDACFDDKDQLNHRYHAKRALYLSHVATVLQTKAEELSIAAIEWGVLNGDPRRPTVVLKHANSAAAIRLLPAISPATFPLKKLAPGRNNLRSVVRQQGEAGNVGSDANGGELAPTPHYNASIVQDMMMLEYNKAMQGAAQSAAALGEAAVLLRVWAQRQRLATGADGVGGFFLTSLLAHLLECGQASSGMSAMHLFRATLLALRNPKTFAGSGLTMRRSSNGSSSALPTPPDHKAWRAAGDPVIFLDSSGWLNLGAEVSTAALAQAKACAARCIALLSASAGPDVFDAVFLAQRPLASLYDVWYRVQVPDGAEEGAAAVSADLPSWKILDRKVGEVAARALGSRTSLVRVLHRRGVLPPSGAKKLKAGGGAVTPERGFVLLGARLDPTAALRAVDIGPVANSGAPAAEFRAFWGDKAELRRFQDGKIAEAVVWDAAPSQRHLIVDQIVRHALQLHLPPGTQVSLSSGVLDGALIRKRSTPEDDVAAARQCEAAMVRLGKRLRALEGLALRVVGTQPLAAVLRHADAFPPLPHPLAGGSAAHAALSDSVPRCLRPVELVCQLEGSGRWPDAPVAFAKMKAALGVQLAQALQAGYGVDAQATEDCVDVLTDGFAFRLLLHTERDAQLQALAAQGMPRLHPQADMPLRVWHQGAVSAAAAANPAFEPSVRLAKRWVASQWLSPHLQDEAVELLVVAAFAGTSTAPPPATRISGFLAFLRLLADHPWGVVPLVIDSSAGEVGREAAARAHAGARASEEGAPALFVTGPKANECVGWTSERPSKPVLHRAVVLARRAADHLEASLLGDEKNVSGDNESSTDSAVAGVVFAHDEREYEVLIRLRSDAHPARDLALQCLPATENRKSRKSSAATQLMEGRAEVAAPGAGDDAAKRCRAVLKGIPGEVVRARGAGVVRRELLVGFDPLEIFVSLLEERFGGVAVVCADYLGGATVGLKLKGPAMKPGQLRPEAAHAVRPMDGDIFGGAELTVGPDLAAVAADTLAMGAGLVERVEYKVQAAARREMVKVARNPLFEAA